MPRGSLSFQASPGGLPVPKGCPVLSVWPWRALLSCFVLSCMFSPGGLLIPPHFPREIFLGGVVRVPAVGARPRGPRPRVPKTICHGLQSSQLRHGLQSSQLHHGLLSFLHRHGFQSSQLRHGPCLSVPLWRSPSCVLVRICPEGPPERPVMSVLCRVCHVFPPLVSIFGLFPVLVSCHYELSMFQLCLSRYVLITLCILVLSFEFDFVWSTRYVPGVSCPCQSCLVLP